MKITLLAPRLDFVNTGTPKIHARDLQDETNAATMCGRPIWPASNILTARTIASNKLCRRCVASLATYTGRFGTKPKVRFEQEEAQS